MNRCFHKSAYTRFPNEPGRIYAGTHQSVRVRALFGFSINRCPSAEFRVVTNACTVAVIFRYFMQCQELAPAGSNILLSLTVRRHSGISYNYFRRGYCQDMDTRISGPGQGAVLTLLKAWPLYSQAILYLARKSPPIFVCRFWQK